MQQLKTLQSESLFNVCVHVCIMLACVMMFECYSPTGEQHIPVDSGLGLLLHLRLAQLRKRCGPHGDVSREISWPQLVGRYQFR